ncbi:PREDICTED: glutathione S-transferase T3-like [Brassica oleracea var. oleracea]|uniref:glutathione S-transferase T3-like n=1 Tax=Brassica oleracea var. oleracea TaxID=109376 RepID=UPI0006A6AA10|nr:PREDICTED: glutathione S-transferase T3-like [Brassica oleracea var. oleracea]
MSLSVALVGDLSLGGSPGGDRALSRWLFRNRKFVVCWFCLLVVLLLEAFPRWLKSKLSPQIESQLPNNEYRTQFLSFSPSPDVGGSASSAKTGEDRKQRCKWSIAKDLVLISAWLNNSKDPLVGNEQKAETFWKRITAYYNASPKVVGLAPREQTHCKQRWGKINEGVCKFVGSFEAATKQRTSGQNEDAVLKAAHEIFFNDYKVKFSLEHAWRELRNDQKWCGTQRSSQQSSGSKRKRVGEEQSFQSSASMPSVNGEVEAMDRPIGVKAAKAKAKRPVGEEVKIPQGFKDMWEMRTKDLAFKDKLSNKKLLDSLIAKKEPLTELEVALKNKLITEMLSM